MYLNRKHEVIIKYNKAYGCVQLGINSCFAGVVCPDFIRDQWQERLIIDLDSGYPYHLLFTEDGIVVDLSFGGRLTRCSFPWDSIYGVADRWTGRGIKFDKEPHTPLKPVRSTLQPKVVRPPLTVIDGGLCS